MPQKPISYDQFLDGIFPMRGIDVSQAVASQPDGTTRVGVNVRMQEPGTLRDRGGARSGTARFVNQQVSGDNDVQELNIVVDPTTDALLPESDTYAGDIPDPSTSNRTRRQPPSGNRRIRRGGSGAWFSRNTPKYVLYITPDDQIKTQGSSFTFVGDEYSAVGLQTGDSIGDVVITSAGTPTSAAVGMYPISIGDLPNATILDTTVGFTFKKKYKIRRQQGLMQVYDSGGGGLIPLIFSVPGMFKVQGVERHYTISDVIATGLQVGDVLTAITITSAGFPAAAGQGVYPIVLSNATGTVSGTPPLTTKYSITYSTNAVVNVAPNT